MIILSMILLNTCLDPKIINTSKYKWNKYDQNMLDQAKTRCGQIYKDAPCVKLFKKYDYSDYSVICGAYGSK